MDDALHPQALRTFIGSILREVGPLVESRFGFTGPVRYKNARGSEAITEVDFEVEDRLRHLILARFPDHAIEGEERGARGPEDAAWRWHLDPIDGTLNYSLGIPMFSSTVAVRHGDRFVAGGVLDPLRGELFSVARGCGAYVDNHPLKVSERGQLSQAIFSFQSGRMGVFVREPQLLQLLNVRPLKMRRLGSIALELAYVAAGRLDLLVAGKKVPQNLHDVAAGVLLVEEAGGRVTDARGGPFQEGSLELVASNGRLHDELLEAFAPLLPPAGG